MTRELKHCPFCGNAAAWCDEHHKDEPHECHHIVCTACNAQFDMSGSYNPETLAELKDYCGKRFNTRTEQASQSQTDRAALADLVKTARNNLEEGRYIAAEAMLQVIESALSTPTTEQASQPQDPIEPLRYPTEATPALQEVLGLMIMTTCPIAHAFRAAGYGIPTKTEAEQSFVLHWLIRLALEHGEDWRKVATERIKSMQQNAV